MFVKNARTGVVLNKDDFSKYRLAKERAKAFAKTKRELTETSHELTEIKGELQALRQMVEQLVKEKAQ
jgi:hypothetical protein